MAHTMLVSGLLLVGVLISVEIQDINALACRVCRNATSLDDCTEEQTCSQNEYCCTDEIITPSLQIIFNGGCRTGVRAQGNTHVGGMLIACSRCCNSTGNSTYYMECNSNMCGLKSRDKFSQCFQCGGNEGARQGAVADGMKCRGISVCDDDQTCFVSTINDAGIIKHEFGCAQKLYCQMHTVLALEQQGISSGIDVQHLAIFGNVTLVGRKRHTEFCYSCCGDSLCNNAECSIVKDRIMTFARQGRLDYSTLKIRP